MMLEGPGTHPEPPYPPASCRSTNTFHLPARGPDGIAVAQMFLLPADGTGELWEQTPAQLHP